MYCTRLAKNTGCKNSPSAHHRTTLSGCIFHSLLLLHFHCPYSARSCRQVALQLERSWRWITSDIRKLGGFSTLSITPLFDAGSTFPTAIEDNARRDKSQVSDRNCFVIRLEARLRPNIGNTLRPALMVFMRSGITPPKANRFEWNLEHSQYIVWG